MASLGNRRMVLAQKVYAIPVYEWESEKIRSIAIDGPLLGPLALEAARGGAA